MSEGILQVSRQDARVVDRLRRHKAMYDRILERKPLILDVNSSSLEEAGWVLGELSHRGLCLNARFSEEVLASLPAGESTSETWVLCWCKRRDGALPSWSNCAKMLQIPFCPRGPQ